jgi:hypothetical protein
MDVELARALKQAHTRPMFFAFIPKGSDGMLIVSPKEIPPKTIVDAKKAIGGGGLVVGTCSGPLTGMVFRVAKGSPPSLAAVLKRVIKRETGLHIVVEFQLAAG